MLGFFIISTDVMLKEIMLNDGDSLAFRKSHEDYSFYNLQNIVFVTGLQI